MGCTHSRSEDLYKKSIINSETFMGSISETPGYFSRTVHTLDFVESKFPNPSKTEMSYTGPPSHLQNSIDVHPFWSEFGRNFDSMERYQDMTNGDIPRSLLPGTDTAQEMRNLELKESLQDLRSQVKAKMAQSRPIPEEETDDAQTKSETIDEIDSPEALTPPHPQPQQQPPTTPAENSDDSPQTPKLPPPPPAPASLPIMHQPPPPPPPPPPAVNNSVDVPTSPQKESSSKSDRPLSGLGSFQDEKAALDLLDSVISESLDFDEEDVSTLPKTVENSNWSLGSESFMKVELRRRNKDTPVPGVMHDVAPVGTRNSMYSESEPVANGGKNVLRSSMYLPDASFTSPQAIAAMSKTQQPLSSYRVEAARGPNPLHSGLSKSANPLYTGSPLSPNSLKSGLSVSSNPLYVESEGSVHHFGTGMSSVSTDTGIFSDGGGTTNSASSNDSGLGSGGHGVQDLVKIYNEQSSRAGPDRAWKTQSVNLDSLGGDRAWKRQSANLDNLGRSNAAGGIGGKGNPPPRHRRLSQPDDLPLENTVPRNSAILDEIRAELQMQLK